jgi:hypothetical protein
MAETEIAIWRARAGQARRVAGMLSVADANLVEAFALECDDHVRRLLCGTKSVSDRCAGIRRHAFSVSAPFRRQAA